MGCFMNARKLLERMLDARGKEIMRPVRYYDGPDLESGGTSIQGGPAPAVRYMIDNGMIKPGMKILDYGAGAYARNADFLRELGYEVYACDEFNYNGDGGWSPGDVAKSVPSGVKFDFGFTSYVLNVVKKQTQDLIIQTLREFCRVSYHATRNMDLWDAIRQKLADHAEGAPSMASRFFCSDFAPGEPDGLDLVRMLEGGSMVPDEVVTSFCLFGARTTRGFQRLPMCELPDQGRLSVVHSVPGWKIYR